jgi:hypothetical protein
MSENAANKVRDQSDQMAKLSESWDMVHALMGGTSAMRKAGKALLPKWPNEDDDFYKNRLGTATLHPVFRRTVLVNAARPFSKPPTVESAIPEDWLHDIDLQGSAFPLFANSVLCDALAYGLTGILVEYPKAEGIKTQAEERAAGVRPYFVKYGPQTILGWKVDTKFDLTQLRLLESVEVDDGEFATATVEQVRVLEPGRWRTYRQNEKKDWVLFEEGTTSLGSIPFVFCYGIRVAFGHGHSPLLDLAFQNVEHWQSSSDQQTILHVARVPILVAIGFGDEDITIGASTAVATDNEGASLEFCEHTGAAIGTGRQSLLDLEERMRATGAELISQKQAQTTATQISAEGEAAKSTLQQIVEGFEESLATALGIMAEWVSRDKQASVELFKSFETLPDADAQTLSDAVSLGVISKETHFKELQRRDVISLDVDWEEEQKRVAAQTPVGPPQKIAPQQPEQ